MPLTEAEKRANKVARTVERYKALRLSKCVADVAKSFQLLVRLRAVESDGKLTCCSCGNRDYPQNSMDSGHWQSRKHWSTIFDFRNCAPQCAFCNRFASRLVTAAYDEWMLKTYGQEVMDELIALARRPRDFTREELAELKQQYLDELRGLESCE